MSKFFRVIRYSSVGTFVVGIIAVIQGCDVREGAAAIALLFLLQFCSSPLTEEAQPLDPRLAPGTPIVIDDFSVVEAKSHRVVSCGVSGAGQETTIPQTFGAFNARQMVMATSSVGTSALSFITPGDGTLEIRASNSGDGCAYDDNIDRVMEWEGNPGTPTTDMSTLKRIEIDVVSATGVTGCIIQAVGSSSVKSASFNPAPSTVNVLNPGWPNDVRDLRLMACDFAPGGSMIISEVRAIL